MNDIEEMLPELEARSSRQLWYAEQLRHKYIEQHEERFNEIFETVRREVDKRDFNYNDDYLRSFDLEFNNFEKAVLYGKNAGGVIAALKEAVGW